MMQTNLRFVGYRGFSLVFYDEATRNEYICRCDNTHLALSRGYTYSITHDQPLITGDVNYITGAYLPE